MHQGRCCHAVYKLAQAEGEEEEGKKKKKKKKE
jgi:hypothetical protein